jgi:hypothetical protein
MVSQLKPKLKSVKMHVAYCRCQGKFGVFVAVLPELPDVVMQKSTVIPRVHGMYKHNRTLGRTTQVMSLKTNELNPVKIVFPSCTSVDISEKMEISVHTVQRSRACQD